MSVYMTIEPAVPGMGLGEQIYLTLDPERALTPEEHARFYNEASLGGEQYREMLGLEPPLFEPGIFFRCGGCARQLRPEQSCFCQNPHPMWKLDALFFGMTFVTPDGRRIDPLSVKTVRESLDTPR